MFQCGVRWMYGCRSVHSATKLSTANLGKLRKKTGFSITKCKNALEKFDNSLVKAEQWLREQAQKEGWAKATKLQGRAMSQGLVGVTVDGRSAVMVEVNCETDFVARNQKFQGLVSKSAGLCLQEGRKGQLLLVHFGQEAMSGLAAPHGKTLADLVALEVGNIGENMAVRRGVFVQVPEGKAIGSYVHTADLKHVREQCVMGKYGALVVFSQSENRPEGSLDAVQLGSQLGLHVVGMNPLTVGKIENEASPDDSIEHDSVPQNPTEDEATKEEKNTADGAEPKHEKKKKQKQKKKKKKDNDDETSMLHQMFIGEDSINVAEFLEQNGASVESFVRFECGEQLPDDS